MARTLYFYTRLSVSDLNLLMEDHKRQFDEWIGDQFDDQELERFEKDLDQIAAIYVQPILSELTFDDFYPDEKQEQTQRDFFGAARSSLCLENLPYLESNPFQVSWLLQFLNRLDQALIDQGGVSSLVFKEEFIDQLKRLKNADGLLQVSTTPVVKKAEAKSFLPVDPIDFLILDVYKEIARLKSVNALPRWQDCPAEKARKLFSVMSSETLDPAGLYMKSGLIPKDFDDLLERLKFWLRSL